MAGLTVTDLGWTVSDALGQFDAAGMPVDQAGFRAVVRAARRTGNLKPLGETKSGEHGGRGQILYEIGELQRLHSALAPWLISRELEGALPEPPPVSPAQPRSGDRACREWPGTALRWEAVDSLEAPSNGLLPRAGPRAAQNNPCGGAHITGAKLAPVGPWLGESGGGRLFSLAAPPTRRRMTPEVDISACRHLTLP